MNPIRPDETLPEGVIVLEPGAGRQYPCGPMHAAFLADGAETGDRYSVSLWWVEPDRPGPGAHSHAANEELFYVVEGTMTFQVGDRHLDAGVGTFLRVPAGVLHDFYNRSATRAGVLNVFIPGGFEANMAGIVEWFRTRPEGGS
jgi:mannose-6-phosphate isomerase-like protein (cupin superfamily)